MGYGYYRLSNGREAGYGVEAECDDRGGAIYGGHYFPARREWREEDAS